MLFQHFGYKVLYFCRYMKYLMFMICESVISKNSLIFVLQKKQAKL